MTDTMPTSRRLVRRPVLWGLFAVFLLGIPLVAALTARARQTTLPVLGAVPGMALVDQNGRPFTTDTMTGKIWIVDFVFTNCSAVCPRLTAEMKKLADLTHAVDLAPVALLSVTVDPERDTPEVLARYARSVGADYSTWKFVTGPTVFVEQAVVQGFKIAIERNGSDAAPSTFDIIHGMSFILVDAQGRIRGYYDSNDPAAVTRLRSDVAQLKASPTGAP
jgi:protein SCO1/2